MASNTFEIAAAADNTRVSRVSSTTEYPPTGTISVEPDDPTPDAFSFIRTIRNAAPSAAANVEVGLLKWDTSSLPNDAVVTGAILRVVSLGTIQTDSLSVTADWFNWGSVDTTDHTNTPGTDAHSGTTISSIPASGNELDFTLVNANANVSLTGFTYLRLHVTQRAADARPTGDNVFHLASYNNTTYLPARLIVTYEVGGDMIGVVHV